MPGELAVILGWSVGGLAREPDLVPLEIIHPLSKARADGLGVGVGCGLQRRDTEPVSLPA